MRMSNFYGTIAAGKSSDLVIVNENSLKDIKVIANRRLYLRKNFDTLLQAIKH